VRGETVLLCDFVLKLFDEIITYQTNQLSLTVRGKLGLEELANCDSSVQDLHGSLAEPYCKSASL